MSERDIFYMVKKNSRPPADFADTLTKWVGTKTSLVIHTIVFVGIFGLQFVGVSLDQILLVLTTFLSIEAIYLAIFIQISVNKNTESLEEVEQDIDEIQEDVEDDDEHDQEVQDTLLTIEQRLIDLHNDLEHLRKKMIVK